MTIKNTKPAITIVAREDVLVRRKTARYGKPIGSLSNNQGYLAVPARDHKGRFSKA